VLDESIHNSDGLEVKLGEVYLLICSLLRVCNAQARHDSCDVLILYVRHGAGAFTEKLVGGLNLGLGYWAFCLEDGH